LALLAIATGADKAYSQALTSYFSGKTVTIVVGSSPGGIYDIYARLMGRYLGKHIPGQPIVIVSGMPGADGETAAAYVARQAPKDGTFIAATTQTQPLQPILSDAEDRNYDPSRMNYLGNAASDVSLCIVRSDAPATTFDGMFETQVILGGTAPNGPLGYLSIMFNNVLGTKFKEVLGYPGSGDVVTAVQRGEIQGMCGISWSTLAPKYAALSNNGAIKIVVQASDTGLPELNKMGVPLSDSYARNDDQRRILDIIDSQGIFARPYFVAADVPADRVAVLRNALMETWRDPELIAEAAKMNLPIAPMSGEEIQALLQKIYASPPDVLQRAKEAIKLK